jgi:hypothetical protein
MRIQILRYVFEFQIIKYCKLLREMLAGSVNGAPYESRPLGKTLRNPRAYRQICLGNQKLSRPDLSGLQVFAS